MKRVTSYTVLDMEMTGLNPKTDRVIEIGAARVRSGRVQKTLSLLVNPGIPIPIHVVELTGITDEMAVEGLAADVAMEQLLEFLGEDLLVGQNISFDYSFLAQWAINQRKSLHMEACDTLRMARALLPAEQSRKLEALCSYFGIPRENAHRALDDALETAQVFEKLQDLLEEKGPDVAEALLKPRLLNYRGRRQTPATKHQLERLKDYRLSHGIDDAICLEKLTRSEASRLQDQYFARYGR